MYKHLKVSRIFSLCWIIIQTANASTLKVATSFPSPLKFHHIQDWQDFESDFINACAIKLISIRGGFLTPDLAESWDVSPDGKEYTFKIRHHAKFSDGSPLEASAAAYAIERHLRLDGQNAKELKQVILGANAIGPKGKIPGIAVLDANRLKLTLTRKHEDFLTLISMLSFSIFRPEDLDKNKDEIKLDFVASGPYKVKTIEPSKILLERNMLYWNKDLISKIPENVELFHSKDLSVNVLKSGMSDVVSANAAGVDQELLKKSGFQFVRVGLGQNYLLPDFKGKALSQVPGLVRSIHLLLSREKIVSELRKKGFFDKKGTVALTAGIESLDNEFAEKYRSDTSDLAKIQNNLKSQVESLKQKGLKLTLAFRNSSPYTRGYGETVASELEALGIPVDRLPMSSTEITLNENSGRFDLRIVGEMWDITKPALALKYIFNTDSKSTNIPADHKIFKVANSAPSTYVDHIKVMREFNHIALDSGLIVPLLNSEIILGFAPTLDISRVPLNDLIWYPQDLSFKAK